MKLESDEFANVVRQSAALRGNHDFAGAIALIESNLAQMEPDCLVNAYLECFYAAKEAGMQKKASEYAHKLAAIDSQIPTVKAFLKGQKP